MQPAIHVQNLGKRYRINHAAAKSPYRTLRESFTSTVSKFWRRRTGNTPAVEDFWALKDVSFDIQEGEVVGIIGRNGAGKSTLLKILSRITKPTHGRGVLRGRVASLLEVGTGFHPELTGRENIYLNGSILGMNRREIAHKFEEIVSFAEIDQFLDTPVKRYSSGMYVRLAFAIAAHLDPDILIVDEVLAVGDTAFQNKCIGKMKDVAAIGRTVLVVTHNIPLVHQLCDTGILLSGGRVLLSGTAEQVTEEYLSRERFRNSGPTADLRHKSRPETTRGSVKLVSCRLATTSREHSAEIYFGTPLSFHVVIEVYAYVESLEVGLALCTAAGIEVASSLSTDCITWTSVKPGRYEFETVFSHLALLPGNYYLGLGLRSERGFEDYVAEALDFDVLQNKQASDLRSHLRRGILVPECKASVTTLI